MKMHHYIKKSEKLEKALNRYLSGIKGDLIEAYGKERALADLLWPLPLAICIYFPLFYVFQMWETHRATAVGAVILWGIPSILGILGLWANRHLFQKQTV